MIILEILCAVIYIANFITALICGWNGNIIFSLLFTLNLALLGAILELKIFR